MVAHRLATALGLAIALGAGAHGAELVDYALIVRQHGTDTAICATSAETCAAARTAIKRGWLPDIPIDAPTQCEPHPGCFSESSKHIVGGPP